MVKIDAIDKKTVLRLPDIKCFSVRGLPVVFYVFCAICAFCPSAFSEPQSAGAKYILPLPKLQPLVRVIELNIGQTQVVELHDGSKATVKVLDLRETCDNICQAVRRAEVDVQVNGQTVTLVSATYHLPTTVAGVRIDCPITRGYQKNCKSEQWGLGKDVRLRLWPADSPLLAPGTFVYPVKQKWFSGDTQMANEPVYVDGGEKPDNKKIYYHWGLDFGGVEDEVEIVSATDGLIITSGTKGLPISEYHHHPVKACYDEVYIIDDRGWFYCYAHLKTIDAAIQPGRRIKMGQKIGTLGKEGQSGGWSHLHLSIRSSLSSGKLGVQAAYGFVWEAYQRQYNPHIIAVARPHHVAWPGEKVVLDGTRSWSKCGKITRYKWSLSDGSTVLGDKVERSYKIPGTYSEVLKITDDEGNIGYDFSVVQIFDKDHPDYLPPAIHACYDPMFDIKPGDKIIFAVRSFHTTSGREVWDFGDGSPKVTVQSDGNIKSRAPHGYAVTTHRYKKPGDYIVTVKRCNERGHCAVAHLHVRVETEG